MSEPYRELVQATALFRWIVRLAAIAAVVGLLGTADDGGSTLVLTLVIGAMLVGLMLVELWFMNLRVEVGDEALVAAFGPIKTHLRVRDITDVQAEPYQWLLYGGWGLRFGFGKRRAWTVPFLNTGVRVTRSDGTRYFISSRSPERLAAAVASLIGQSGGIRG